MGRSKLLGAWGEAEAAAYLRRRHYQILASGFHSRFGEIDLIARNGKYIVFVEVKLRSVLSGNNAAHAVDGNKLSRIQKGIENFFEEYKDNMYVTSLIPRIDVFEIYTETKQNKN